MRAVGVLFAASALTAMAPLTSSVDARETAAAPGAARPQQMIVHQTGRADPPGAEANDVQPVSSPAAAYSGKPVDVTTYHYDHWRTGWNSAETDLTPATVASGKFGLLKTLSVDGLVLAQPLLVSGLKTADGQAHDVLVVATEHNSVYAFDAKDYSLLWRRSLGPSQSSVDVGCGDIAPEYGISGTPVVLREGDAATLYVVAATEPQPMHFVHQLHALDLGSGKEAMAPSDINPTAQMSNGQPISFDPQNEYNRTGLALSGRTIYFGVGSHCDNKRGKISGWLLAYNTRLKPMASFNTIDDPTNYELASIWMSGFAPATDAAGDVYVTTGNGRNNLDQNGHDTGQSVLHFWGDQVVLNDSFTPDDVETLNKYDLDLGSGGLVLVPPQPGQTAPPLALVAGKNPVLYLLDADELGGHSAQDANALQALKLNSGLWGGPAVYRTGKTPTVLLQTDQDVLRGYRLDVGARPKLSQVTQGTTLAGYGGSMPIVSSDGARAGTGVAWVVRRSRNPQLEAYDAEKLGAPIFSATAGHWNNPENNAFVTAVEANGRVYVATHKTVTVFGLTQ